jgi:5-(aminomethyl)-3-furanmethanol phosphate kinase
MRQANGMRHPLVIVKVGGSLYDVPDLAVRVRDWLDRSCAARTLLVPGGGPLANAIRGLDRIHRLGEEASHWLALQALSVNAHMLSLLLPEMPLLPAVPQAGEVAGRFILDPLPFFKEDERHAGCFPHLWQVTSDSLAVRVAMRAAAAELVLLKSVAWQAADGWVNAARTGVVDGFFDEALRRAPKLAVRVVNLRDARTSR